MAKRAPKSKSKATPRKPPSAAVRPAGAPVKAGAGVVYPLKITLDGVQPPIWRRVQVKDCTLAALRDVIQISMGWHDCHLHIFEIGDEQYGAPDQWEADPWGEHDVGNEGKVKLSQLVGRGVKKFRYEYDMGDGWRHTIQVYKTLPVEAGVHYPRCVEGGAGLSPGGLRRPLGLRRLPRSHPGSAESPT